MGLATRGSSWLLGVFVIGFILFCLVLPRPTERNTPNVEDELAAFHLKNDLNNDNKTGTNEVAPMSLPPTLSPSTPTLAPATPTLSPSPIRSSPTPTQSSPTPTRSSSITPSSRSSSTTPSSLTPTRSSSTTPTRPQSTKRAELDIKEIQKQNPKQRRETVTAIQDKFDNDEVVSIRGFFSSGTNWLRALLKRNCGDLIFEYSIHPPFPNGTMVDVDGIYGWKHGLILEKELSRLVPRPTHKLVIISREAPTWVVSAFKMAAMERRTPAPTPPPPKHKKQKKPTKKKHTSPTTRSRPGPTPRRNFTKYINLAVEEAGVYGLFQQCYYDNEIRNKYRIRVPNVLAARTTVYRNWMKLLQHPELKDRVHFIRYEDLYVEPYEGFRSMLEHLHVAGCNVSDSLAFDPVIHRIKMGREYVNISLQDKHPRAEFCSAVRTQLLYHDILSKVDRTFEAEVLGYTYPDTREEYCQDVALLHNSSII